MTHTTRPPTTDPGRADDFAPEVLALAEVAAERDQAVGRLRSVERYLDLRISQVAELQADIADGHLREGLLQEEVHRLALAMAAAERELVDLRGRVSARPFPAVRAERHLALVAA